MDNNAKKVGSDVIDTAYCDDNNLLISEKSKMVKVSEQVFTGLTKQNVSSATAMR